MWRVIAFFIVTAGLAFGLAQFADQPGLLELQWGDYKIGTSLYAGVIALAVLFLALMILWSLLRTLFNGPRAIAKHHRERREKQGRQALSRGMIAVGAGDRAAAHRYAAQAANLLQHEPLVRLLKAQDAQLRGDPAAARREFQAMLDQPETEELGLRGLFLEGKSSGDLTSAMHFAERAMRINPALPWATTATLEMQCTNGNWDGALHTIAIQKQRKQITKQEAARKRAVVLAGQALNAEDTDADKALRLAQEAVKLSPGLVAAAVLAAHQLSARGSSGKAAKILEKAWREMPHPDIAAAYAHVRQGDSGRDRLKRVRDLAKMQPHDPESHIAVATAAVEAHEWEAAREALQAFVNDRPSQRVCTLMARIEGGDKGDRGLVREWLARAVRAPRDPAWVADGHVSERWAPASPVTGQLDAYRWEVPKESLSDYADDRTLQSFVEHQLEAVEFAEKDPQEHEQPIGSKSDAAIAMTAGVAGAAVGGGLAAESRGSDEDAHTAEETEGADSPVPDVEQAPQAPGGDMEAVAAPEAQTDSTPEPDAESPAVPVPEPVHEPAPGDVGNDGRIEEVQAATEPRAVEPEEPHAAVQDEAKPRPSWDAPAFLMREPKMTGETADDSDRRNGSGELAEDAVDAAPEPLETEETAFAAVGRAVEENLESADADESSDWGWGAPVEDDVEDMRSVELSEPAEMGMAESHHPDKGDGDRYAADTAEETRSDSQHGSPEADGAETHSHPDGARSAEPTRSRRPAYSAFWDEPTDPA